MSPPAGPSELLLVRHGESVGNLAAEAAWRSGAEVIDIEQRDADVPLSELGEQQAQTVGTWLRGTGQPDGLLVSPYLRARQTARLALQAAGFSLLERDDERLRDRELGVLDRLTSTGVESRFPEEAERKRRLGKLYHRPPGGESWADVALRVRSLLADLDRHGPDGRVLVVSHDAVIMCFRYVCEGLDETRLLHEGRAFPIGNASVTRLVREDPLRWRLDLLADQQHLVDAGLAVAPGARGDSRA